MATWQIYSSVVVAVLVTAGVTAGMRWDKDKFLPEVGQLLTDYWNFRTTESPEYATLVGLHNNDHLLDTLTLAEYEARLEACKTFRQRAEDLLHSDLTLGPEDVLNLKILKEEVQTYIDGYPFMGFLFPLSYSEGIHQTFEQLVGWMVRDTFEDYEKVLARYALLPTQVQQVEELLREGVSKGLLQHEISMKGVVEGIQRHVVEIAVDSPLWRFVETLPDSLTWDEKNYVHATASDLIVNQISPAFAKLKQYVERDYPTRPSIAVTSLPYGAERYEQLIRFHTSSSLTPYDIHQLGLDEVTRIEGEMAKIVSELGYDDMSVPEFSAMLRNDTRFYLNSSQAMMDLFDHVNYDLIHPELLSIFTHLPIAGLEIVEQSSPEGPLAFYLAGSYDGSRPGHFYVNTYFYDKQPTYEIMTLSLHEGNPGHHLQASHSLESSSMAFFRRAMEDRNYYQAPSRFPMNTAFIEGWGLYAETLGFDMKLYNDPYDRYGHYSFEIFRACRLVVDTGMHALAWSRDQAVEYMTTHTAMATQNIENEVDRYITWPGQALAYKIGQITIRRLREKAQAQLGDAFHLGAFHEVVLEAVGPLTLLEQQVDEWIAAGGGRRR